MGILHFVQCLTEFSISPTKAFSIVRRQALAMLDALQAQEAGLAAILAQMSDDFLRYALKTSRKKSPATFVRLQQLSNTVA